MSTKIICLSDLHGILPSSVPECDILIIAGDLCPVTNHQVSFQAAWLAEEFTNWATRLPVGRIIGTAGNHDWIWQTARHLVPDTLPMTVLIDEACSSNGIKFWGTPWQPPFRDWAFNLSEWRLAEKFALIPDETDVLISHGPPSGYGDVVTGANEHLGSLALRLALDKLDNLTLVVCGHVHSGHGIYLRAPGRFVVNASCLNEAYEPVFDPILAEFDDNALLRVDQL